MTTKKGHNDRQEGQASCLHSVTLHGRGILGISKVPCSNTKKSDFALGEELVRLRKSDSNCKDEIKNKKRKIQYSIKNIFIFLVSKTDAKTKI